MKGLVIGLAIAAPVGPIGVLCIRRTLADGRLIGLLTGLGAATASATPAAIILPPASWCPAFSWARRFGGSD